MAQGFRHCLAFFSISLLCIQNSVGANQDGCILLCDDETMCVTPSMRCDLFPDCLDLADELQCGCRSFRCPDAECAERCDGHIECADASDEQHCTKEDYHEQHPHIVESCIMPCMAGVCYFDVDGQAKCHCDPGAAGIFCNSTEMHEDFKKHLSNMQQPNGSSWREEKFGCETTKHQIPAHLKCDGHFDCSDRSDEVDCTRKDYQSRGHSHQDKQLCLMKCDRGSCTFDDSDRAFCDCPSGFEGQFCDIRTSKKPPQSWNLPVTTGPALKPIARTSRPPISDTTPSQSIRTTANEKPKTASTMRTTSDESNTAVESDTNVMSDSASAGNPASGQKSSTGFTSMVIVPGLVVICAVIVVWLFITKPWAQRNRSQMIV